MIYIYLDLNVFDQIEKLESLTPEEAEPYQYILDCLNSGACITVYTNAHISDLVHGYKNSPSDTTKLEGHLHNLSKVTNNLCMCLYFGHKDITVDYRDVFDFFNSSLEDSLSSPTFFAEIFDAVTDDGSGFSSNLLKTAGETITSLFSGPIPEEMEKAFEYPLYQKMFPKTFETRTMSSMMDDIFTLSERLNDDPSMYRELKRLMNPNNFGEFSKVLPPGQKLDKKELKNMLKSFDLESAMEMFGPKTKTSENPWYDKVTNLYSRIDFKGFNSDKEFANMINDANHTFYAAHCAFFLTNDARCQYKATEVYKRLNVPTPVLTPKEFLELVKQTKASSDEPASS